MISKYLKELVESNNRIIIPDFGAFMIQDSPEGKQISFNDFLKFNDGLLINQIIKTEKISKNQATEQIKDFIKEVEKSFSQKKPYEIKGLGFLSKDTHNSIKFDTKIKSEPVKISPTDIKPTIVLDEKKEKPKAKVENKTEKQPLKEDKKTPSTPIVPTPKTPTQKAEIQKKEVPKPMPPKAPGKKAEPTTTNIKQNTIPATKTHKSANTYDSSNNTTKILIIIAAAIIILGGGTWAFFKYDLINLFTKTEVPATVVKPVAVAEPVIIDTVAVETVEEPIVVVVEPIEDTRIKYYLIGGSFKIASNAENFNQKLIDEGYESEIIVRNNGFNCVSYNVFYEWNDIVNEWRRMKNTNPQIWILIQ